MFSSGLDHPPLFPRHLFEVNIDDVGCVNAEAWRNR
jgi:hypothetical protein